MEGYRCRPLDFQPTGRSTVTSVIHQLVLDVDGMTCTGCGTRVEKVLSRVEGVRQVRADHKSGQVQVAADAGVSERALAERLAAAGYPLRSGAKEQE